MTVRLRLITTLLSASALIGACSHGFVSPYGLRGLRVHRPMFEVQGMRLADQSVRLSFATPPRLRTQDPTIRGVSAALGPREGFYPDTVDFDLGLSGHPSTDEVINVVGHLVWDTPTAHSSTEVWVDVSVLTATDHLVFTQQVSFIPAVPLDLDPFQQPGGDNTIELGMHVKRIFVPKGEYLPSSERFRVIVSDSSGAVVWRSDAGVSHSTLILNVEPQNPSEKERLALKWDGRTLSGTKAVPGRYRADLIIPAKPTPYQTSIEFTWPPNR